MMDLLLVSVSQVIIGVSHHVSSTVPILLTPTEQATDCLHASAYQDLLGMDRSVSHSL